MATTSTTICCAGRAPRTIEATAFRRCRERRTRQSRECGVPSVRRRRRRLIAAAEALTNPPDLEALGHAARPHRAGPARSAARAPDPRAHQDRHRHRRLDPRKAAGRAAPPRERHRRSERADPEARAGSVRLRLDLAGTPERNEANVIIALTSDPAFAGVLAFDEFAQEIVVRQPLPWDAVTHAAPPLGGCRRHPHRRMAAAARHQRRARGGRPRRRRRRPRAAHPSGPRLARHPEMGRHAPDRDLDQHLSRRRAHRFTTPSARSG
jgi:hypothetical protein